MRNGQWAFLRLLSHPRASEERVAQAEVPIKVEEKPAR